ncbi:WD40 repeat protein [Scheffersomyces coipomensis]|uniref:WD40 repeat protein n=1 Tax=Scheffersomyces coipomensis TaxID=1788519 RepID=UPI00315D6E18
MVWINSCPSAQIPLPFNEEIVKIIHVPHTPLLVVLTSIGVYVFDQFTLLPITSHVRNQESINQHGHNVNIKTKHVSVNTAQLQKLNSINFFVHTTESYLIVYHCSINYTTSLFEISNSKNDELIQTGLPLSVTSQKFNFTAFFKNATRHIIQGSQEISFNLENIEHFNNSSIEDELGNFEIENAKVSIFKILKIGIGLNRYWLKQNSHNLIVFNTKNERNSSVIEEEGNSTVAEDNYFQIVNMQTFKNEVFHLSEYAWYEIAQNSKIIYINYNIFKNYFIFLNELGQLWYFKFEVQEDRVLPVGSLLTTFPSSVDLRSTFKFTFNPQSDLILLQIENDLKLYKVTKDSLEHVKDIQTNPTISQNTKLLWSSCGTFFIVLDKQSSEWTLFTKFGSDSFNSSEILKELDDNYEDNRGFLKASNIIITPNANGLNILSDDKKTLYYVNLLKVIDNACFYDNDYISIIQNNNTFIKFPMLPRFKRILSRIENYNGTSNKSLKSVNGVFKISRNESNQLAISYGEYLALSTPLTSGGNEINHVLWFNFKNYYLDTLNIVHQFWFNDYLIIVNRKQGVEYDTEEESNASSNDDKHLVDEIIIFDAAVTKYGAGGADIKFDNDLMLWKYDFKTTLIDIQPVKYNDKVTHLVLITDDFRLIIIELNNSRTIAKTTSSSNLQNPSTQKNYKIFIGVNKTIHLSSIKHRFAIRDIIKTSMIDKRHFLFLLNSGDLYLLKNQTSTASFANPVDAMKPSNMYDLIRIGTGVEFFKFKSIKFDDDEKTINYVYLFNGDTLLIYEIEDLISNSYDKDNAPVHGEDEVGIEDHDIDHHTEPDPIRVEIDNYQPLILDSIISDDLTSFKSIDLIGVEHSIVNKPSSGGLIIKNRISHKLILNNFMEYDLIHKQDIELLKSFKKFELFKNYHYCLELLLFKYLTRDEEHGTLRKLIKLIESTHDSNSIYINCLRKIEVGYWDSFFTILETTPLKFMRRLIDSDNVEHCYNYLIVYLNFKKEGEDDITNPAGEPDFALNNNDKEIIIKIMNMLDKSQKWDWCFELCRFIKLLQPSGDLLKSIKQSLE